MGDSEDDARYPQKFFSLNRQKHPMFSRPISKRHAYYQAEDDEEEEEDDDELEDSEQNGDEEEEQETSRVYKRGFEGNEGIDRYPKRQKMRNSMSGYEFTRPSYTKLAYDWTENEAFVLLEVWGEKFLQLGKKSLRSEDWNEVAEKVSEEVRVDKSEAQCRRMMDNLKRKYKKEKVKVEKTGLSSSKWAFFSKMDMLMSSSARQENGLACGVDSGEFIFMNTRVYLDRSNGSDEMMDSPGDSELDDDDEKEKKKDKDLKSYKILADSVHRLGKIYETIESSKREHMKELEKMRSEFQRELESHKKQILQKAQVEITKIREENEEEEEEDDGENETDVDSAENVSD